MTITTAQLAAATGCTTMTAANWIVPLSDAMEAYSIGRQRAAMFLANVGVESGGMSTLAENLNYSVDALLAKFGRHRISEADARRFGRSGTRPADQQAIANALYGGEWGRKTLGNAEPGDGWRYRGQGLLQTTGRANCAALTRRLRARLGANRVPDFVAQPELLQSPVWAAWSACDYVDMRALNVLADAGDFDGYCDTVNIGKRTEKEGDSHGYPRRLELYRAGQAAGLR
jgi:putative chitinase